MRLKLSLMIAAAMLAGAPAAIVAQTPRPTAGRPTAAMVEAGSYVVESHHTLVEFSVDHFGFSTFFGVIPNATGTMTLDPRALGATRLDISLPVAGISTTNAKLDGELTSADWFDAAKYPAIRFVSDKVIRTGPETAQIHGQITLHGVTKPLVLSAHFHGAGSNPMSKAYTVGFDATGELNRSDFGVSKYVPVVSDTVHLKISAAFEKAK
ncbi:YceI family protein [Novosphingobium sp.]|uniref:YceI family protein n=1 Tax=Novosphingobium sp. TaxID=1874826 RepID=UPI003B51F4CD